MEYFVPLEELWPGAGARDFWERQLVGIITLTKQTLGLVQARQADVYFCHTSLSAAKIRKWNFPTRRREAAA